MNRHGSNIDCLTDNPADILKQLAQVKIAGGGWVRWQFVNDARAMASWTPNDYATWLGNRFWVFEQCQPFLLDNGMPTILDFHHPFGGLKDGKWRVFYDDAAMAWHLHFVELAAERFKNNDVVFALEIFNEPHPQSNSQLWNAYKEGISRIRAKGFNKHIIIDHKTAKTDAIAKLKPLPFNSLLYSVHLWPDWTLDPNSRKRTITKAKIRDYLAKAIKWERTHAHHLANTNSGMFLGEFGCHYKSGKGKNHLPYSKTVAAVANDLNWPWCWLGTCHYDHHAFRATQEELNQILA